MSQNNNNNDDFGDDCGDDAQINSNSVPQQASILPVPQYQQQQQYPIMQMPVQPPTYQMQVQDFQQQQAFQVPQESIDFNVNLNSNSNYTNNNIFGGGYNQYGGGSVTTGLTLLNKSEEKEENAKKVVAVIVTFCNGSTYDNLFTSVEQKSVEGTRVLVYSSPAQFLPTLLKAFESGQKGQPGEAGKENPENAAVVLEFLKHIASVDPDCVVFNWECSSSYGSQSFTEGSETMLQFLELIIKKGYMAMFSDFSLKALTKTWPTWKSQILGPCPLKKIGGCSGHVELNFATEDLRDCPSAQLQIVGEMSDGNKVNIHAAGDTIVYAVDQNLIPKGNDAEYTLKVLTVAKEDHQIKVPSQNLKCTAGKFEGAAGHVLFRFKAGGVLLTSMGHWIELMKIDTSEKKLFDIAEKEYGAAYAMNMKSQWASMDVAGQKEYVQKNAVNFIQNQAPCSKMSRKKGYE